VSTKLYELHIRSWRSGRAGFTAWHLFRGVTDRPLCNADVPDHVAWCELHESSAVLTLTDLCRRCLKTYAESE